MIIKRRTKPLPLQTLDALITRVPSNHPKLPEMKIDAAIRNKGYYGEQQVDYHLERLLPHTLMLQDVCLSINNYNVQIDTILITNYAIYCIESKNFEGKIIFNTALRQFIRDDGGNEAGFRDPISQVETQKIQLMNWLHQQGFKHIPIHYFIAVSDPRTIIEVKGDELSIAKIVAHAEHIPSMILAKDQKLKAEGCALLPTRKIGQVILNACQTYNVDILRQYAIKKSDILPGVKCPACHHLGMRRYQRSWHCIQCGKTSKDAHLRALNDYFILIRSWLTNNAARRFLKVESRHIVKRLLKSSNLTYQPNKRAWTRKK